VNEGVAACDASISVAYEQLRSRVLAGSTSGDQLGLMLMMREGTAAWMARRSTRAIRSEARSVGRERRSAPLALDDLHVAVVRVLASMALGTSVEMTV
jgi:hypothetical protein